MLKKAERYRNNSTEINQDDEDEKQRWKKKTAMKNLRETKKIMTVEIWKV